MTVHYDFDAMKLNVDQCVNAIKVSTDYLPHAFDWRKTPQGSAYWQNQMINGLDLDAKATLAYFVAQSMEFEMNPFMAKMHF